MDIGKEYRIDTDAFNIIVCQRHVVDTGPNKGQVVWDNLAYFATLHGALGWIAENEVKGSGLQDLKALSAKLDDLKGWIREAVNG